MEAGLREGGTMVKDLIVKETRVAAPRHEVWSSLADVRHIGRWFGNGQPTRGDLEVGGTIIFDHGPAGDIPAHVEALTPDHELAFRWRVIDSEEIAATADNSTVVRFMLSDADEGTVVTIIERGFATLKAPPAALQARYDANDAGWARVLANFASYVGRGSDSRR